MVEPSGRRPATPAGNLPETHLAMVIEDVLAAVEPRPAPANGEVDLRAVLLYGWAIGARSAADLAQRTVVDTGMRYLVHGAVLEAAAVRDFRDRQAAELGTLYQRVFALCHESGIVALGEIRLDAGEAAAPYGPFAAWLAAYLMRASRAADAGEIGARALALPSWAATRAGRRAGFQAAAGGHPPNAVPTPRGGGLGRGYPPGLPSSAVQGRNAPVPRPPASRLRVGLSALVLLLVVATGLGGLRWLAAATAPPKEPTTRPALAEFVPPDALTGNARAADDDFGDDAELLAAYDEALRLAIEAIQGEDLVTARSFYILALAIYPDDEEATAHKRQIETAQGISGRRDDWSSALSDLTELREMAPESPTLLRAYVTALVGAGREALDRRDLRRAGDLCGEATRWFPEQTDARQCLLASGFAPTVPPPPPRSPTPLPVATAAVAQTLAPGATNTPAAGGAASTTVVLIPTLPLINPTAPLPTNPPPAVATTPVPAPTVLPGGIPIIIPTFALPFPPTSEPVP